MPSNFLGRTPVPVLREVLCHFRLRVSAVPKLTGLACRPKVQYRKCRYMKQSPSSMMIAAHRSYLTQPGVSAPSVPTAVLYMMPSCAADGMGASCHRNWRGGFGGPQQLGGMLMRRCAVSISKEAVATKQRSLYDVPSILLPSAYIAEQLFRHKTSWIMNTRTTSGKYAMPNSR